MTRDEVPGQTAPWHSWQVPSLMQDRVVNSSGRQSTLGAHAITLTMANPRATAQRASRPPVHRRRRLSGRVADQLRRRRDDRRPSHRRAHCPQHQDRFVPRLGIHGGRPRRSCRTSVERDCPWRPSSLDWRKPNEDTHPLVSDHRTRWMELTIVALSGRRFVADASAFAVEWQLEPTKRPHRADGS